MGNDDKVRFSDVLREFNRDVESLPPGELAPIRAAFAEHIVGKTFDPDDGVPTADRADLEAVVETLPKDLKAEGRQLVKAMTREINYRGENWATRSAVLTLVEHLPALAPTETVAAPAKAKGKGKK